MGQEASEEWAGAKPEAGPRPRVLDPADRARAPSLVIINLTTPTINPTMVSNNYNIQHECESFAFYVVKYKIRTFNMNV